MWGHRLAPPNIRNCSPPVLEGRSLRLGCGRDRFFLGEGLSWVHSASGGLWQFGGPGLVEVSPHLSLHRLAAFPRRVCVPDSPFYEDTSLTVMRVHPALV